MNKVKKQTKPKIKRLYKLPILPKSRHDPIGAQPFISKAFSRIRKGKKQAMKRIKDLFNSIPVRYIEPVQRNAVETLIDKIMGRDNVFGWVYTYDKTTAERIATEIDIIITEWLATGYELKSVTADIIEETAMKSTMQSHKNLAVISTVYADRRSLTDALYSDHYRNKIELALLRDYEEWVELTAQERNKLSSIIAESVVGGRNPVEIVEALMERLDITASLAENIAQTEITNTLRQFRIDEANQARALLGLDIQFFWTSALIPTTRPWHASRHGKIYTDENIQAFYAQRGNRYRCHCSITEVVMENGNPMLPNGIKDAYKKEKDKWNKDQEQKQK